ncbi:heme ABC exporter ATP-binding protein CcmA [Candidatus Binatus sp.]|uniref:heme ABC exporter ATP-binding protein CcmA n=1 Tax=Candidatus Binatus sp. TaxID=2811406 RepID=UPI003C5006E7
MSAPVVETHRLAKTYGLAPVLREVDLRVLAGAGTFVIGGNGSGKSTLLRILAGLEAPSGGHALVFGQDTRKLAARYRRRVGMIAHQSFLYPNLSARENLEFYAELYSIADPHASADQWLDRVGLAGVADARVRTFSRGMEQRLAAARAMLHAPALLLRDAPFASLDHDGAEIVAGLIRGAIDRGAAVIATAHAVPEIEGVEFAVYEIARGLLVHRAHKEEVRRGGRIRSLLGR